MEQHDLDEGRGFTPDQRAEREIVKGISVGGGSILGGMAGGALVGAEVCAPGLFLAAACVVGGGIAGGIVFGLGLDVVLGFQRPARPPLQGPEIDSFLPGQVMYPKLA